MVQYGKVWDMSAPNKTAIMVTNILLMNAQSIIIIAQNLLVLYCYILHYTYIYGT